MPQSSGPYTPVVGQALTIENPLAGSGPRQPTALVLVNLSPYELVVSTPSSSTVADLIDPYTRDAVPIDLSIDSAVQVTPISVGIAIPGPVQPQIFALWYLPTEPSPSPALPSPITIPNQAQNSLVNNGAFTPVPVSGFLTVDLSDVPGVFRSALVTIRTYLTTGGANVGVTVFEKDGVTLLEEHSVKMAPSDYKTFRLPLTPSSSDGTMGLQIQFDGGGAANVTAIVTLDTTPAPPLPFQLWSDTYTAAGYLGPSSGGRENSPRAAEIHTNFSVANGGVILDPTKSGNGVGYVFSVVVTVTTVPEVVQLVGATSGAGYGSIPVSNGGVRTGSGPLGPQRIAEALTALDSTTSQTILGTVHWSGGP